MNSSMSGWSALRITILAARRVLPPDLIVPADASAPRMKLTGPDCGAAALQVLVRRADVRQVDARARTALEDRALFPVPVEDRVHRVVDGEDEARARLLRHALHADVEPHRRVERGALVHEDVLELVAERLGLVRRRRSSRRCTPQSVIVSATRSITWRSDALALGRCRACRGSTSGRRCWWRSATSVIGNSTSGWKKASLPSL